MVSIPPCPVRANTPGRPAGGLPKPQPSWRQLSALGSIHRRPSLAGDAGCPMPGVRAGRTLPCPHSPPGCAVALPSKLSRSHHLDPLPPSCPQGEPLGHPAATRTQCSWSFLSQHQGPRSPPCQDPSPSSSRQPLSRSSEAPWGAWPALAAGTGCGREVTPGRRRSWRARHPAQLKHILFSASCILPHPRAGGAGQSGVRLLIAAQGTAGQGDRRLTTLARRGSGECRCGEGWVTSARCWAAPVAGRDTSPAPTAGAASSAAAHPRLWVVTSKPGQLHHANSPSII